MRPLLRFAPEVRHALNTGGAVVALESTIVAHGMPFPQSLETARAVEEEIRAEGAVPAHIAVLDGVPCIGLLDAELHRLAELGPAARKTSRRDLASVVAAKAHGATTVAGTMALAHLAGIEVFVTGGVGGVHRGGHDSLDVSADLTELGRTPVAVVCAGVKSILDIGRTLEVLETQGVPVVGFGTDTFPSFYTPASAFPCPARVDSEAEVAAMILGSSRLGLSNGMLVGVPNWDSALDAREIEVAIQTALRDAAERGVAGRDATPFLLDAVRALTGGQSLEANVQLVRNNARVGARIAVALSELRAAAARAERRAGVAVVGGAVLDLVSAPAPGAELILGTSNPGQLRQSFGGVGRNVAECVARLGGTPVSLVSAVGDDGPGRQLLDSCRELGIAAEGVTVAPGARTAVYAATLDGTGDLCAAVADMDVLETLAPADIARAAEQLAGAAVVVVDGNVPEAAMRALPAALGEAGQAPELWFEPTSVPKAVRAVRAGLVPSLTYMSPNEAELRAIAGALGLPADDEATALAQRVAAEMADGGHVVLTLGARGAVVASAGAAVAVPAQSVEHIVNTSGAGDSFVGGAVWGLARGLSLLDAVGVGMDAAQQALGSEEAINPGLRAPAI